MKKRGRYRQREVDAERRMERRATERRKEKRDYRNSEREGVIE